MTTIHRILPLFLTCILAACGGGGGGGDSGSGVLTVTASYSGSANLFRSSTIAIATTGLQGHAPNCSLSSGTLPRGMVLNGDCSITGTPTEVGSFNFSVRLGASGVSNQLDISGGFAVFGPSVAYAFTSPYTVGATFDVSPLSIFWTPLATETVNYSVATGQLPPGLTLDANTGRIHGTITAAGDYNFGISATASNGISTATIAQLAPTLLSARVVPVTYSNSNGWTSQVFSASPTLPIQGATYQFSMASINGSNATLPSGLTLDPATGVISGIPSGIVNGNYGISALVNTNGTTLTLNSVVNIIAQSPVYIYYPANFGQIGQPSSFSPAVTINSPNPMPAATYQYSLAAGDTLPAGLSLNPVTGVISGTSTSHVSRNISVNVAITNNGVTFTVVALGAINI